MIDKQQLIQTLKDEFKRWEDLLASMSEAELSTPDLPDGWSVKDVIAHLMAWQQRSIARLEAALADKEPEFPGWPADVGLDSEEVTNRVNAWIYDMYHDQLWSSVYQGWREGFLRFIDLAETISESDLLNPERFAWMNGRPLSFVLDSSYEHHHIDHLEPLLEWRRQQV